MAQSPYPIRLPKNLRSLLEVEAAKHGQSLASYIVGACWAKLERHGGDGTVVVSGKYRADDLFVPADPTSAADVEAAQEASRIARHMPKLNPDMPPDAFSVGNRDVRFSPPLEVPICGKTWWEDGEHWECLMDAGHKELKHGMRGMVRKLGD